MKSVMTPAVAAPAIIFRLRNYAERDLRHEYRHTPVAVANAGYGLRISDDLSAVEGEWRAFERKADCTAFQTFDWVSAWHRNIGAHQGTVPAIVVGRDLAGPLFILPLAIERGAVRRLTWLASDLCDYNAPLLATDFAQRMTATQFLAVWRDIAEQLQSHPNYRFDYIRLEKMPQLVGAQANPMLNLRIMQNPSHAYLTQLDKDWETFYGAKRSSTTRRRDRSKSRHLAEFGALKFVNFPSEEGVSGSVDILMRQKSRQFANMGVYNIFAKPGYAEFYRDVAVINRELVHVSRLDVGAVPAAVNLGLIFRGCYYHVQASYDDGELSKYGPGAAHLRELMGYAITRGCMFFDFTIGDEPYKQDWSDRKLKLFDHIGVATTRGAAVVGPLFVLCTAKRWIKQTPMVWNVVTKLRAWAGERFSQRSSAKLVSRPPRAG